MKSISKFIFTRSIRTQMNGAIFIMVFLVVIFMVVFFPLRQKTQAYKSLESKGISLAEMLAYNLGPGLEFGDIRYIEETVEGAKRNKDVIGIYVADSSDKEIFSYMKEGANKHSHYLSYSNKVSVLEEKGAISITASITSNNKALGTLILGLSTEKLGKEIGANLRTAIVTGILVLLLGMIVGRALAKLLTEPIQKLRHAAEELSKGNLDITIDVNSSLELKSLVDSFNQMSRSLKESQAQLQEYGRTLEEKVKKKTAELVKAKDEQVRVLKRVSDIMENMVDGVIIADMQRRITDVNPAAIEQLGYEKEELIGKLLEEAFIVEEDISRFVQELKEILSGKQVVTSEYLCRRKDNTRFPASINFSTLRNPDGKPTAIIAVHRDITKSKQAEEKLSVKMKELEEFNRLVVGREKKMIELKEEVNRFLAERGMKPKYEIVK